MSGCTEIRGNVLEGACRQLISTVTMTHEIVLSSKQINKNRPNKSTCLTRATLNILLRLINMNMALRFWIEREFVNVGKCLRRGQNRSTQRKTSRSKDENQQQTQPTYNAESGNRTRAKLMGGECSHHCTIPAPQINLRQNLA